MNDANLSRSGSQPAGQSARQWARLIHEEYPPSGSARGDVPSGISRMTRLKSMGVSTKTFEQRAGEWDKARLCVDDGSKRVMCTSVVFVSQCKYV
jgi:hypothetical protein